MRRYRNNSLEKDRRSTKRLFQIATSEFENRRAWDAIHVLRHRGTREIFEVAKKLCDSRKAKEREVGVDILAQIGAGKPVFLKQSVSLLIQRLKDSSPRVVSAAGVGLGHRNDARAVPYLTPLKDHPNAGIRYGIAFGLSRQEDPQAIRALIELSKDEDRDVRDYATFGLAELMDKNTKAIRDALFARLKERDTEIRGQALIGLAKRNDRRVLPALRCELRGKFRGNWCVEAAELSRDASLHPLLLNLSNRWRIPPGYYFWEDMQRALKACRPVKARNKSRRKSRLVGHKLHR